VRKVYFRHSAARDPPHPREQLRILPPAEPGG